MVNELALQRNKYKHLSDEEWRWFLQQVEGRERTADKLPTFAAIDDWWYPVRLSCEQCSSEATARYNAQIVLGKCPNGKCLDLTGGYGVDTYFLSEQFDHTDYVEQNAELCRIAEHNFAAKPITIHHSTAEDFLASAGQYDLIFLDPARRDSYGGKVFRLEDCTPNVVELLPALLTHGKRIMIKLSPMLDITQAVTTLSQVTWDIYVVAIKNEVKEVLLLSGGSGRITAIDLSKKEQAFTFTREEEINSEAINVRSTINSEAINYLYEPNAAILKAGAYKLVAQRFGLQKLDVNTHLYTSETLVPDFPGRVFKALPFSGMGVGPQANVLVRNYPLTAEQLKKKLHLRDGGTAYVIGCRVAGKPTIFLGERVS
jgi:16S rRNA G966 N2-methylase RsmD